MRIEWTAAALRDLAAIRVFIAADDPRAAERQLGRVLAAVTALARFPELGRSGRRPTTRELVVTGTPYIVPYRLRGEAIEILRVLHGRQRWPDRV